MEGIVTISSNTSQLLHPIGKTSMIAGIENVLSKYCFNEIQNCDNTTLYVKLLLHLSCYWIILKLLKDIISTEYWDL